MEYTDIVYKKEDGVAILTLNRPKQLNALKKSTAEEIVNVLEQSNSDDSVGVLVVTGAGRAFCAGGDISEIQGEYNMMFRHLTSRSPLAGGVPSLAIRMQNFEKPTIAAVNGIAAGAGLSLALSCDIRIASESASFQQIFIRRGLIPDEGSTYFLPRAVGIASACEMVFTGDPLDAIQAKELGLINRVTSQDNLMPTVLALAQKIAVAPRTAMKLAKRALYNGSVSDLRSAVEFEGYLQGICFNTEDFKRAIAAFMEKKDS